MSGTLVYVMGPSGSGKDSLIAYARRHLNAARAQSREARDLAAASPARSRSLEPADGAGTEKGRGPRAVLFARRHITRPTEPVEAGEAIGAGESGERHHPLTCEEFQRRRERGDFALFWESHGLCYGVGREIDAQLAGGAVVVLNGSREYLPEALKKYPALVPLFIAVRPEVLRARLEKRGRENAAGIEARLARAAMALPEIPGMIRLDNSGDLEEAGQDFAKVLERLRRLP